MNARETWKACHRANRRWRNFSCHACGGRCAAHHAVYPVTGYSFRAIEYHCPCGGLNLYDADEARAD